MNKQQGKSLMENLEKLYKDNKFYLAHYQKSINTSMIFAKK